MSLNHSNAAQEALKKKVAEAAIAYVGDHRVIGIGSGSTVNYFIEALALIKHRLDGCVAASAKSAARLQALGIPLLNLASVEPLTLYVDGADSVNYQRMMLKGGGGALTREKILATVAQEFVCMVDSSKVVSVFQQQPVAVEVIPMARSLVARELVKLGGVPVYREHALTNNGHVILDVFDLDLTDMEGMENRINSLVGVVENGIFARRLADVVLVADEHAVMVL